MEYMGGGSCSDVLKSGPFTDNEIAGLELFLLYDRFYVRFFQYILYYIIQNILFFRILEY